MKKSTIKGLLVLLLIIAIFVIFAIGVYFFLGIGNLEYSNGEPASFGEKVLTTGMVSGILLFVLPELVFPFGIIGVLVVIAIYAYKTTKGSKDKEEQDEKNKDI